MLGQSNPLSQEFGIETMNSVCVYVAVSRAEGQGGGRGGCHMWTKEARKPTQRERKPKSTGGDIGVKCSNSIVVPEPCPC
jgi:hypothetical protein